MGAALFGLVLLLAGVQETEGWLSAGMIGAGLSFLLEGVFLAVRGYPLGRRPSAQ